ncbi:hypothetical protein [Flavobacterium hercynium]|uniref:Sugar-binding protein n=1 Tax=Flavobacterium hercynium TaxID=387094 RepID=A0A226GZ09_9FLAO|nr:hypothetical protein [Flavobacterium hercynium]OXA87253.1 hypothetical protein B0A66_16695 [Flavobacterium hercynium]SMP19342.1 hypothetical protein SAMN06265346_10618 [Flavobacterium hercynium]
MKKNNLISFLLLLFLVSCNSQEKVKVKKGHIKSTKEIEYNLVNNIVTYSKGERVSLTGFGQDHIENFDSLGNLKETYSISNLSPDLKFVLRSKYEYNKKNQLVSEIRYTDKNTVFSTTTCKYDKKNRLEKEEYIVSKNRAGYQSSLQVYMYDKNPILKADLLLDTITNKYEVNHYELIKKDKNNNILETIYQDADDKTYREEYHKYDKNNNCISTTFVEQRFEEEKEKSTFDYEYNSHNDIVKSLYKTKKYESVTKYQYEYDKYGNWIIKKVIKDDGTGSYFEREISYY